MAVTGRQFARDLSAISALPPSRFAVKEPLYRRATEQFAGNEAQRALQAQQMGGRLQQQEADLALGQRVTDIARKEGRRAIPFGVANIALKGGLGYANIMADRKSRRQWQDEMDKYDTFLEAIYQNRGKVLERLDTLGQSYALPPAGGGI